jgi:hypothetical protein
MEARLNALRGGGGGGDDLLNVLSAIAGAFTQVPGTSIEALSFRGNVLDLKIAAKDVASLAQLQTLVAQRGLQADLQSSNVRSEGVEGRLQIKGRGSS